MLTKMAAVLAFLSTSLGRDSSFAMVTADSGDWTASLHWQC